MIIHNHDYRDYNHDHRDHEHDDSILSHRDLKAAVQKYTAVHTT